MWYSVPVVKLDLASKKMAHAVYSVFDDRWRSMGQCSGSLRSNLSKPRKPIQRTRCSQFVIVKPVSNVVRRAMRSTPLQN